jgi:hypothetical protein
LLTIKPLLEFIQYQGYEDIIVNKAKQWLSTTQKAQVFNQKHQSERVMFEYQFSVQSLADGKFEAERVWQGLAVPYIAKESIIWCPKEGLQHVAMHQPHLNESGNLTVKGTEACCDLSSKKTQFKQKSKSLHFTNRPCTLLSIPFEVMHHWQQLVAGETLYFDYTVLKVQAHTGVSLKMRTEGKYKVVSVTPEKWFWRLLFGATDYYFEGKTAKLVKIIGLLEPRDRNLRGKYVEYLGRAVFNKAVDFSMFKESGYE